MHHDDPAITALFTRLGLAPERVEHPPVHTVEEAEPHWRGLPGRHTKNLFLRDKEALFLVTLAAETRADMKALAPLLGAKKLSFASPDRLMAGLGTAPGALGPLSLVKDEAKAVRFAIERSLWDAPRLTCHPLRNTATVSLAAADLRAILADLGVEPIVLDLGRHQSPSNSAVER